MEKVKKVIWEQEAFGAEDSKKAYLLDIEDIEERVDVDADYFLFIHNVDANKDELNKMISEYDTEKNLVDNMDNIIEFLQFMGYEDAEYDTISYQEPYPVREEQLCFDMQDGKFCNLLDFDTVKVYPYWDGSNHKFLALNDMITETEVEIIDDEVSLDEWDGRNLVTGGVGRHQYATRIVSVDGLDEDDAYLIKFTSQWQGEIDEAKIMNRQELMAHLVELERDGDFYLEKIDQIK